MWAALNVESAAQLSVGGVVRCQGLKVEGGIYGRLEVEFVGAGSLGAWQQLALDMSNGNETTRGLSTTLAHFASA